MKKKKIAVINSFPNYMAPAARDLEFLSARLGGECVVLDINNLAAADGTKKFDVAVSFNCVNIFHPEISKMQINADIVAKILAGIARENKIIYKRDKHFNGMEVLTACDYGRLLLTDKVKVLITVPCYERICKETLKSIYNLIIPENVAAEFDFQSGYTVVQARNRQVEQTLAGGFDYTLFVDSDVILPQNLLVNLLNANADLATGWYIKKIPNGPKITEIYARQRFDEHLENISEDELVRSAGRIVPIGGCGFGCVLVKNSVFADLKEFEHNWFEYVENRQGDVCTICSEDLKFCERLRAQDKILVCDPSLRCSHVGQYFF
ncbi:MAG: hypothetical protein LBJ73_02450 [Rickettsiales bacterium]|jgi:hypothetical protein|nr:hypothetical protein [Rickettsiales bacterium]